MKKLAIFLSSNQLGGAERSCIIQMSSNLEMSKKVYLPILKVDDSQYMISLLNTNALEYTHYLYPDLLYSFSRQKKLSLYFFLILLAKFPLQLCKSFFWFRKELKGIDVIYANGLKAAFYIHFICFLCGYKKLLLWSFRDYFPSQHLKFLNKISSTRKFKVKTISNSFSVKKCVDENFPIKSLGNHVIYNPVDFKLTNTRNREEIKILATASMLVPWKGIHQLVLFWKLYEKQIKDLGIDEFHIYGKDIYQTAENNLSYEGQLRKLTSKLKLSNVFFKGLVEPVEIFNNIDLLVHSSLDEEPFGRIIVEAFFSHCPVISTALGGAQELVGEDERAIKFFNYDYAGLFAAIEKYVNDQEFRQEKITAANDFVTNMNAQIPLKMREIIHDAT